jgi:hypothetical protein
MPEQELDLLQLSTCLMAETRACSTQVVRRQFVETDTCNEIIDRVPVRSL